MEIKDPKDNPRPPASSEFKFPHPPKTKKNRSTWKPHRITILKDPSKLSRYILQQPKKDLEHQ